MIDIGKQYRTAAGDRVVIYKVYPDQEISVHGAMCRDGMWKSRSWYKDGRTSKHSESMNGIFEITAPPVDAKVVVWGDLGVKYKRYSAGCMQDGKLGCYSDGHTSWIDAGDVTFWPNWEVV